MGLQGEEAVAANLFTIDGNTGGPCITKDTAFSGALGANVRSREFLALDTDGSRLWGWCICP